MNKWERKLWFQKNKGKLIKRGTIALSVLLLVVGVIYITYSKFESTQEFTIINGKIVDNGDVKISFEYDGTKQSIPPQKADGYILTEANCENGNSSWDDLNWKLTISNMTGKTKCNLVFSKTSNYKIVTYNANGGEALTPTYKKVVSGEQIGELPIPRRVQMVFTGWYTQASGGTKIESTTTITSDMTIYAQWKTETETVIFNSASGGLMTSSIAGGWKSFGNFCASGASASSSYLFVTNSQNSGCTSGVMTNNKINFSNYSAIKIYVDNYISRSLTVAHSETLDEYNRPSDWSNGCYIYGASGYFRFDIRDWNNLAYLNIGTGANSDGKITYISLIS